MQYSTIQKKNLKSLGALPIPSILDKRYLTCILEVNSCKVNATVLSNVRKNKDSNDHNEINIKKTDLTWKKSLSLITIFSSCFFQWWMDGWMHMCCSLMEEGNTDPYNWWSGWLESPMWPVKAAPSLLSISFVFFSASSLYRQIQLALWCYYVITDYVCPNWLGSSTE